MKSVTWLFSVGFVALMFGGCGQDGGKSIDQEADGALEENKRLKEKIARMEAQKEIDEREREHFVETPETDPASPRGSLRCQFGVSSPAKYDTSLPFVAKCGPLDAGRETGSIPLQAQ